MLRRQVDDLDPVSHRIVEAAAVLGHRIPFDLLADVTGAGEDELIAVLRELVTRGVLVESGEDEFSFRHALVREAIADQMLGRQRRRLHEAALDVLLGTPAAPTRPWSRTTPAAPAGTTTWSPPPAAAPRSTCPSAPPTRRCSWPRWASTRPATTPSCSPPRPGRPGWPACSTTPSVRAGAGADLAGTTTDRADALYLLVRLAWESDETDEMRVADPRHRDC